MAQMHRSGAASLRRRALIYGAVLAAASASMPPGAPMPGAPMPPAAAQMGPEFYVRDEASGLLHGPYPQPPAVPAGYEVVELAPHAQRAEEVRDGGPYFIACSDGQTRGPFGGADVVRLVAQGLAEKGAKCALGRHVATGASSSSSTKKTWKDTKLKHLRVHRWRATRFVAKTAKKGAVQTFQVAATAAPPQLYKTWADEEAEWAKEVVKQQSIVRTKKPSKRRAPPPPPRQPRRGPRPPPRRPDGTARVAGSFDVRKFDDIAAQHGWKADDAEERRVALSKAGYRVGALGIVAGGIGAAIHFEVLKPTDAKHFVTAAVHLALEWCRRHLGLMRGRVVDLIPERWRPVVGGAADALADAADASTVADIAEVNAEAAAAAAEATISAAVDAAAETVSAAAETVAETVAAAAETVASGAAETVVEAVKLR